MNLTNDRLDFVRRETEARRDDAGEIQRALDRKIQERKAELRRTTTHAANERKQLIAQRHSMRASDFLVALKRARGSQKNSEQIAKNLEGLEGHAQKITRQLTFYKKKIEFIEKKSAEKNAFQEMLLGEVEAETLAEQAGLRKALMKDGFGDPKSLPRSEERHEILAQDGERSFSIGEEQHESVVEQDEVREGELFVTDQLSREERVMAWRNGGAQQTIDSQDRERGQSNSGGGGGSQEGSSGEPSSDSSPQETHSHDSHGYQEQSQQGNFAEAYESAQHWSDGGEEHHLAFSFSLSEDQSLRIQIDRREENRLSVTILPEEGQSVSPHEIRARLGSRLQESGFVLDHLSIASPSAQSKRRNG
jgi:hypothetical protein